MASVEWVKWKIAEEWAASLPDRYDPAKAAKDVYADGIVQNYENSYDMHHKIAEATPQEVKALLERQEKAELGTIIWDEERQQLYEVPGDASEP